MLIICSLTSVWTGGFLFLKMERRKVKTFEPQHDKTNKMMYVLSEDPDQPRHLIRDLLST